MQARFLVLALAIVVGFVSVPALGDTVIFETATFVPGATLTLLAASLLAGAAFRKRFK